MYARNARNLNIDKIKSIDKIVLKFRRRFLLNIIPYIPYDKTYGTDSFFLQTLDHICQLYQSWQIATPMSGEDSDLLVQPKLLKCFQILFRVLVNVV